MVIMAPYSKFKNLDTDLKYTFDRQGQLESFLRIVSLDHRYEGRDKYVGREVQQMLHVPLMSRLPNKVQQLSNFNALGRC